MLYSLIRKSSILLILRLDLRSAFILNYSQRINASIQIVNYKLKVKIDMINKIQNKSNSMILINSWSYTD